MQHKQIDTFREYIIMLMKGHVNSVLCHSKAGFGKTYTTINILKEYGYDYTYNSGVTTAVALYKLLYENRNKILVLDDIETIFKDDRIINLLKSALWEVDGQRKVSYRTTSKVLMDYPDTFDYNGKLIILANEIKGRNDESYKALLSRCLKYELCYTLEDLKKIGITIIDETDDLTEIQKSKVKNIMFKNIDVQHNFNFRLLMRLIAFVKYDIDKAETLFLQSIDIDETTQILVEIIKKHPEAKIQFALFHEQTGMSRMTFFRKKKKLKDEGFI